jgi:hypothetical protein
MFSEWFIDSEINDLKALLVETSDRYSIEVNYRTDMHELLDGYSKLVLGFVMAAMKRAGYHVRHVYTERPYRIVVAVRNWDDGEWVATMTYNPHINRFVFGEGFWNKDRKTVSVQKHHAVDSTSAVEMVKMLINKMTELKKRDPRAINKLKPVPMKRGPKK